MFASDVISRVRDQLFDINTVKRWTDAELLVMIGAAQRKMAELCPESCAVTVEHTLVDGPRQRLDPSLYYAFTSLVRNPDDGFVYGEPVRQVERDALDSFYSAWALTTAGATATNRYKAYAKDTADRLAFWLFPSGVAADVVTVEAVLSPIDPVATSTALVVPSTYVSALVDYVTHTCLLSEAGGADINETRRFLNQFLVSIGQERLVSKDIGLESARPPESKT